MKKYFIIDTRLFDVRGVSIELNDGHYIVLENQQYLEVCNKKSWRRKFPETLKTIYKKISEITPVFILPETTSLNLIITIHSVQGFTLEQKFAKTLQQNFGLYLRDFVYQYTRLEDQRYLITLIPQNFLRFIKSSFDKYLPSSRIFITTPLVGLMAYFNSLPQISNPSIAIFIENHLRRFFVKNQKSIDFIDFYQLTQPDQEFSTDTLRNSQQFITQSLDIPAGEKQILIFGDLPDNLLDIYRNDPKIDLKIIKNIDNLSGSTDHISTLNQCLYVGLCNTFGEQENPLKIFNFYGLPESPKFLTKLAKIRNRIQAYFEHYSIQFLCILLLSICCLITGIFYEFNRNKTLKSLRIEVDDIKLRIRQVQIENKFLEKQNNECMFLPNAFLNLCYDLQNISSDFCIDYLSITKTKQQYFYNIKGRVEQKHFKSFSEELNKLLKAKLTEKAFKKSSISSTNIQGQFYEFAIKIPLHMPLSLTLKS